MQAAAPGTRSGQMWRQSSGEIVPAVVIYDMTSSPVLVRRIDKISVRTNPLSKVVVTDNWIVLVGAWPWSLQLRYAQCTDVQQVAITLLSSATSQM